MSKASNGFDPREAVEGLVGYVKDMATSALKTGAKIQPDEAKLEIAVLAATESGAKTATQISKQIGLASGGTWAPTEGQVNRALVKLVDANLLAVKTKGDRKNYSLTSEGETTLSEAKEKQTQGPSSSSSRISGLDWLNCEPKFLTAASKLPPVLLDIAQTATRDQQARAAEILDKARHDLHKVLAEN